MIRKDPWYTFLSMLYWLNLNYSYHNKYKTESVGKNEYDSWVEKRNDDDDDYNNHQNRERVS